MALPLQKGDSRSRNSWFHRSEPRRISRSEALQTLHLHRLPPKGVPRGKPPGRIFGSFLCEQKGTVGYGGAQPPIPPGPRRPRIPPPVGAGTHKSNWKGNSNPPLRPIGAEEAPPQGGKKRTAPGRPFLRSFMFSSASPAGTWPGRRRRCPWRRTASRRSCRRS